MFLFKQCFLHSNYRCHWIKSINIFTALILNLRTKLNLSIDKTTNEHCSYVFERKKNVVIGDCQAKRKRRKKGRRNEAFFLILFQTFFLLATRKYSFFMTFFPSSNHIRYICKQQKSI